MNRIASATARDTAFAVATSWNQMKGSTMGKVAAATIGKIQKAARRSPHCRVGRCAIDRSATLTIVTQLNPINIEFQIPHQVYEFQHGRILESHAPLNSIKLGLVLPDAKFYPYAGEAEFTDAQFHKKTQLMTTCGTFPNPETLLTRGLRVKVFSQP